MGPNRLLRERRGAGLCFRQKAAQLSELVVRRSIYQSLVETAAQVNRQQELAVVFHIHLVLHLDVITVDEPRGRAELRPCAVFPHCRFLAMSHIRQRTNFSY